MTHERTRSGLLFLTGITLLGGCSGGDGPPDRGPAHDPAMSEVTLEAVDASTGSSLSDDAFTVRYLARAPITLDATAVEVVPSSEGYRIGHTITEDSLVLEVRLEAPSYERLDTVLAVAWGSAAGPVPIPLMPRPERVASGGGGETTPSDNRTTPDRPGGQTDPPPGEVDRNPLENGDAAFANGDWAGAARAYARMQTPPNRQEEYAFDYELALVRQGIAHINLGEWQQAAGVLQEAVDFDFREYTAFFYLGQVQCVLGQYDDGRQSLNHIPEWLTLSISEVQRPIVLALIDYQLAMCTYGQSQQARTQSDLRLLRDQALGEFQSFVDKAEAISPVPPEIEGALADARQRMAEIRDPRP